MCAYDRPESTGVIGAGVYILLLALFAPLPYYDHIVRASNSTATASNAFPTVAGDVGVDFPHHSLTSYMASLLSLLIAAFLGFLDDVFDIRWRYKIPIPSESSAADTLKQI